jgi:acetylcholinesterase
MAVALAKSDQLFPWAPVLEYQIIPVLPSEMMQKGHFAKLPFIAGTNLDEGEQFCACQMEMGLIPASQALSLFLRA